MTVSQLIEALSKRPPDELVVVEDRDGDMWPATAYPREKVRIRTVRGGGKVRLDSHDSVTLVTF